MFVKILAKTAAISLISTLAGFGGLVVVGEVYSTWQNYKRKKNGETEED